MISYPRPGRRVQLWYAAARRPVAPHHGRCGTVVVRARGPRPLNHGVLLEDGTFTIVHAGQLREPPQEAS